jgi:serine/threonine-protein kinase
LARQELTVNPFNQNIQIDLAGYYAKLNVQDSAKIYLERVIYADPTDMDIMFRIAVLFEMSGNRNLALAWLKKALLNGFSITQIASYPGLNDLRMDDRYLNLLKTTEIK